MTIVVEDGSRSLANANSYVSRADVLAYAALRGVTIASDDADVDAQIIQAADYLESIDDSVYLGRRAIAETQPMMWPRVGAYVRGRITDTDEIPVELTNCQCELVLDIRNAVDIRNRDYHIPLKAVKAEAEVQFATRETGAVSVDTQATRLLRLLTVGGHGIPVVPSRGGV